MMNQIGIIKATKEDLYNKGIRYRIMYKQLCENTLFKHSINNTIVKLFVDAKCKGNYRSIVYDVNCPELTLQKTLSILKRVEYDIDKPFDSLTQLDIDNYQQRLNDNAVFIGTNINIETKPLSYKYKTDIIATFKQFWRFYRLYCKTDKNIEVPNILEYLRVRRPKNSNKLISFLTKDELETLTKSISSQQMISLFYVFFETGARVIEILKLKFGNCSYDDKKKTWIIKLPNEKGISTQKVPVELTFSAHEFDKWIKANKFKEDDYLFQYSYDYMRKRLRILSIKYLGRIITPKEFRKGMAMYLVNHNVNDQYLKAHMGWSANSKAIRHYINQTAIKRPDILDNGIQNDFYSDVIKENNELKFKQKMQDNTLEEIREELDKVRKEQASMFKSVQNVDISSSKNLLRTMFIEWLANKEKENDNKSMVVQS